MVTILANAAQYNTAKPVGNTERPLVSFALFTVLSKNRAVGSVINSVNRVTTGELLIDTTIILVVMVDVSILLQNRMAFSV